MQVPLSWLKKHLDLTPAQNELLTPEKISEVLTLAGLEVDKIERTAFNFKGVVVAKILETTQHPEADRLKVAKVTDGLSTFQIVCGANNCRSGLTTALARVGAELTASDGQKFKIKKSKLRGIESEGMLCAADELGLESFIDGIMELDQTLTLGAPIESVFGETIFEISLTPNLGHCLSIHGIARELASLMNLKLNLPKHSLEETSTLLAEERIRVSVEDVERCYSYYCRYLENVVVAPSPNWLKQSLENCGVRSINNIVDITNYVMLSFGQPMHAFDSDKIEGNQILIQSFDHPVSLKTLDGIERIAPEETLLICDDAKPLAIAGIMGGETSAITETTTRMILEAAHFNPVSIRKSMRQLGLRTDSSSRFEKGIDPEGVEQALTIAASLIQEITGCTVAKGVISEKIKNIPSRKISCRLDKINRILGTKLSFHEIEEIFKRLRMKTEIGSFVNELIVTIPSYRNDIKEEIDLVEEIARVYGYHNIEITKPYVINSQIPHSPHYLFEKKMRRKLISEGLQELLTCDLISPKLASLSVENFLQDQKLIHVMQPSSIDQSILRPSMLAGLLETAKRNFDHQKFSFAGFEIGMIHFKEGSQFLEKMGAGILLTGDSTPAHFGSTAKEFDCFDLKGILENIFESLGIKNSKFVNSSMTLFHPGQQASIYVEDLFVGFFGQVHPSVLQQLDIKQKIFFAQLDLSELIHLTPIDTQMKALPVYPGSERDWTGTFIEEASCGEILGAIESISSRLMKKVTLLDIYRSEKLGLNKKNVTLRFYYRDDEKTTSQEVVDKEHARVLAMAETKLKQHLSK